MAGIQVSPVIVSAMAEAAAVAFARPALRKSKNQFLEASPKSPFSAVIPSRILSISKPAVRLTLETIKEEDVIDSGLMDSPRTSSASSSSSSSSSCFLESRKHISTSPNLKCS